MNQQFLLHLPDGTQYGPVDRATLDAWRTEGRLPEETLVWPEGAPEWVSLKRVFENDLVVGPVSASAPAPAAARPAAASAAAPSAPAAAKPKPAPTPRPQRPAVPQAPQKDDPQTQPSMMRMQAYE